MRHVACVAAAAIALTVTHTAEAGPFSRYRAKRRARAEARSRRVEPEPPAATSPSLRPRPAPQRPKALAEYAPDDPYADRPYMGPVRRYPHEIPLEELSARALQKRIRKGKIETLDEAMQLLPAELRVRSVLMKSSRSLQSASDSAPRVILYHPEGKLFVGIGTDSNHRSADTIEMIELDENGRTRFNQISMSGRKPRTQRCRGCHARGPVWDVGRFWFGAVGGGISGAGWDDAYRGLQEQARRPGSLLRHVSMPEWDHIFKSRSQVLMLLAQRSASWRAGRELARAPREREFRPALIAAFAGLSLEEVEEQLPVSERDGVRSQYQHLVEDTRREMTRYFENVEQRARAIGDPRSEEVMFWARQDDLPSVERIALVRLVMERMGEAGLVRDWSLGRRSAGAPPDHVLARAGVPAADGDFAFTGQLHRPMTADRSGDALDYIAHAYLRRVLGANRADPLFMRGLFDGRSFDDLEQRQRSGYSWRSSVEREEAAEVVILSADRVREALPRLVGAD